VGNRLDAVLDAKIKDLEAQVDCLRKFREMVARHPAVATEVLEAMLDKNSNGYFDPTAPDTNLPESKFLAPTLKFFEVNGNEWATVPEIARSTGLTANALHTLMTFGKHRFDFEWKKTSSRKKYWRLKVKTPDAPEREEAPKRKRKRTRKPVAAADSPEVKPIRSKWGPKDVVFEEVEGGDTKRVK
jgi:hypothetical protein